MEYVKYVCQKCLYKQREPYLIIRIRAKGYQEREFQPDQASLS